MAKASRKSGGTVVPADSGIEGVFALWGRGNVKAARARARAMLANPSLQDSERSRLERILADTAPDTRARQIAVFALAVLGVVILLTKLSS